MPGFMFDFSDLERLAHDMDKIAAGVVKAEQPIVKLVGNEYKNDVQPLLQYKTGTQRKSVHVEMTIEGQHPVALVGSDFPGARQREYGGVISAKNGEYLRFKGEDGNWVFVKSVYQYPHPAWRPAWDHNLVKYDRMLRGVFDREEWDSDISTVAGIRPDLTGGI